LLPKALFQEVKDKLIAAISARLMRVVSRTE